jgi:hypothetical protein
MCGMFDFENGNESGAKTGENKRRRSDVSFVVHVLKDQSSGKKVAHFLLIYSESSWIRLACLTTIFA